MPLDLTLLERLEAHWIRLQPPWLASLRPGLTDEEIADKLAPTGLVLPPELRAWWGWHDGTSTTAFITPVCEFLSLDLALAFAQERRDVAEDLVKTKGTGDPADFWPPTYLPVFAWADWPIATDCTIQTPSSPLFALDAMRAFGHRALVAPSLGDVIHRWIEMYEAGYYVVADNSVGWVEAGLASNVASLNLI